MSLALRNVAHLHLIVETKESRIVLHAAGVSELGRLVVRAFKPAFTPPCVVNIHLPH
jgi:hypothetical protein